MEPEELLNMLKASNTEFEHHIERSLFIKYILACAEENVNPRIKEIWYGREDMEDKVDYLESVSEWIRETRAVLINRQNKIERSIRTEQIRKNRAELK